MNIVKKLETWQQEKLLSAEQVRSILTFERSNHKPMFMYLMAFLGLFCIGLGAIAIIASNWQLIPANLKLFIDLLVLVTCAGGLYYTRIHNRQMWFEGLTILYALLILGSIGLIAQIYQLQPAGLKAYLLWSALTFPLVFYTCKPIFPLIWLPVVTTSGFDWLSHFAWFEKCSILIERSFPFAISFTGIFLLSFAYRFLAVNYRTRLSGLLPAMKFWLVFDITSLVLMMDFSSVSKSVWGGMDNMVEYNNLSVIIISVLILGTVVFGYFSSKHNYSRLLTCVLAILLGFSLLYNVFDDVNVLKIYGFLLSMSVLGCVVVYALIKSQPKLLNLATALIALRIFIVYIQVFGSLLETGWGLMASGAVFLGIIYLWRQFKLDKLIIVKEPK